jgi:hypothetical protein
MEDARQNKLPGYPPLIIRPASKLFSMNNFLKALEDESSSGISRIFLRMSLANRTKGSNLEPRETLREKKG